MTTEQQSFQPKNTLITDDYIISSNVLGLGINGKVVECTSKINGRKFALKVSKVHTLKIRAVAQHSIWYVLLILSLQTFVEITMICVRFFHNIQEFYSKDFRLLFENGKIKLLLIVIDWDRNSFLALDNNDNNRWILL